ncbi:MAG: WD40 repeat protein [Myxococcota bacterium]|jgi:WD40 repeat protein
MYRPLLIVLLGLHVLGCTLDDNDDLYADQERRTALAEQLTTALQFDGRTVVAGDMPSVGAGPALSSIVVPFAVSPGQEFLLQVIAQEDVEITELALQFSDGTSHLRGTVVDVADGRGITARFDLPEDSNLATTATIRLFDESGEPGIGASVDLSIRPAGGQQAAVLGQVLNASGLSVSAMRFASISDESHVIVGGAATVDGLIRGQVSVWNLKSGRSVATLTGHTAAVLSMDYDDASGQLATGGADNTIRIWDVASQSQIITLGDHADEIRAVRYAPGAPILLSGGWDGRIHVHDTATWQQGPLSDDIGPISAIEFSPPGLTPSMAVATGRIFGTGALTIWRLADLSVAAASGERPVPTFRFDYDGPVTAIAFNTDGSQLVAGVDLGRIIILDTVSGDTLYTLNPACSGSACLAQSEALGFGGVDAPQDFLTGLSFIGPKRIGAVSISGVIGQWNADSGAMDGGVALPVPVRFATFAQGAQSLGLGTPDGQPRIIRVTELTDLL